MIASLKQVMFAMLPVKQRFRRIYRHHQRYWKSNESVSGLGSTMANTENIRKDLPAIFGKYEVATIVDVPCGDFNWMAYLIDDLPLLHSYIGLDLIPEIIAANQQKHSAPNVRFAEFNIINDIPPPADVVFVRDCLVHFSFADARSALQNVKASGARFLMSTTYLEVVDMNKDITTGRWRPINLQMPPYNLPPPLELIRENEGGGKALGLWRVADLPERE